MAIFSAKFPKAVIFYPIVVIFLPTAVVFIAFGITGGKV
jgi:hypothetical protein